MSTAHDHYREAERLTQAVVFDDLPFDHLRPVETLRLAQVHATLALAATHGADKPATNLDTRTVADPHDSNLIVEQMGDEPNVVEAVIYCGGWTTREDSTYDCMLPDGHDGDHLDGEGRFFQ